MKAKEQYKNLSNYLKITDEEFETTQELGTYFIILKLEDIDDIGESNEIRNDLNDLLTKLKEGKIIVVADEEKLTKNYILDELQNIRNFIEERMAFYGYIQIRNLIKKLEEELTK